MSLIIRDPATHWMFNNYDIVRNILSPLKSEDYQLDPLWSREEFLEYKLNEKGLQAAASLLNIQEKDPKIEKIREVFHSRYAGISLEYITCLYVTQAESAAAT